MLIFENFYLGNRMKQILIISLYIYGKHFFLNFSDMIPICRNKFYLLLIDVILSFYFSPLILSFYHIYLYKLILHTGE